MKSEYMWTQGSYCPSFYTMEKYPTISDAQVACSNSSSCRSVVDYYCDNQEIWTCSEDIITSEIGSCAWNLKTGMNGNILST